MINIANIQKRHNTNKIVVRNTRLVLKDAFNLITENSKTEGFFRRTKINIKDFKRLNEISKKNEKTTENIHIILENYNDSNLSWLELYNEPMSIKAEIFFWAKKSGDNCHLMPLFFPQLVIISGISNLAASAQEIANEKRKIEVCKWRIYPLSTDLGSFLMANFKRYKSSLLAIQRTPFNNIPCEENFTAKMPHDSEVISEIIVKLMKLYPEDDYQTAKMALDLLTEFKSMIDSLNMRFMNNQTYSFL